MVRVATLYAVWVIVTYLLEGLPRTLLRPEAQGLRVGYISTGTAAQYETPNIFLVTTALISFGVLIASHIVFLGVAREPARHPPV